MNITTIIELENHEVEEMAGAKLVFAQEQIDENIVETCVDYLQANDSKKIISPEDAMSKVFDQLKQKGVVPQQIADFSFEMPSCGQLKKKSQGEYELPQRVILSYMF
ncbi:hypothetical protein [Bacillus sp. EB600]|uniref:hypothetical protein n=1 Tax=Bacillus sp. EB600 TaxID=2806345 RepID=UPI00210AB7BF|nr:hypothetical protein [Bacillus sp. EB600]MCQ6280744.1 hypothetical protein [Bacillus sp. EB600]